MNDTRDAVAEWIGDRLIDIGKLFVWLVELGPLTLVILVGAYLLWRVSVTFGPMKLCWRCKSKGHLGGLFGGRRECPSCGTKGIRPRIGTKK